MKNLTPEKLIESLEWRYATKKFDPSKIIDEKYWEALEEALILTPSSYGLQPWKFIIVQNAEIREKLKAASWNQKQVTDCSHLVVFAIKEKMDEAHITRFVEQTAKERNVDPETLSGYKNIIIGDLVKGPRSQTISEWASRQIYIALGNFMTSASLLGIDTCPLEGIDPVKYDEILGLTGSGWRVVVACPAGYRASDDKYSISKKIRFPKSDLIVYR